MDRTVRRAGRYRLYAAQAWTRALRRHSTAALRKAGGLREEAGRVCGKAQDLRNRAQRRFKDEPPCARGLRRLSLCRTVQEGRSKSREPSRPGIERHAPGGSGKYGERSRSPAADEPIYSGRGYARRPEARPQPQENRARRSCFAKPEPCLVAIGNNLYKCHNKSPRAQAAA